MILHNKRSFFFIGKKKKISLIFERDYKDSTPANATRDPHPKEKQEANQNITPKKTRKRQNKTPTYTKNKPRAPKVQTPTYAPKTPHEIKIPGIEIHHPRSPHHSPIPTTKEVKAYC